MATDSNPSLPKLFQGLYQASTEDEVTEVLQKYPDVFRQANWHPYGDDESFYGVIENQQASPIPALVEKITNSIDAILMRRCYEAGIEPKSDEAPRSMEEAIKRFFPSSKQWDLPSFRKQQADSIQIIADGPRFNTSLIIYDDGEGQHPEDFEKTFLSLLRGNKNEIHFVQGKYNMGGSGAIVFCGKHRYQLVASKRYDGKGQFGFTLIRRHPFTEKEKHSKKNTWYEYFRIDGKIPAFEIAELDLGLFNRKFTTGTILKLYSYNLPPGSRSVISRDLNQSLNEYLFEPALPVYTIDNEERYPDDRALQRELYGLKRRLEEDGNKYIEDYFVEEYIDKNIGRVKITCYVFKPKAEGRSVKETKETISREFFKNNMAVLFSVNGQVHGHYTSEFTTRALKYQLLKDYLLIHVDCNGIDPEFRSELFMASRDRLKDGEESKALREIVAETLRKGKLNDIYKRRKDSISLEGGDTSELLRSFTKNLPLKSDLLKLLNQTFKLDEKDNKPKTGEKKERKPKETQEPFKANRFPSFFKIETRADGETSMTKLPLGGEKNIKFSTDVENQYFVRVEEPGELKLALLKYLANDSTGGDRAGDPKEVDDAFNVVVKSPDDGTIKIVLNPTDKVQVGDAVQLKATLTNPGNDFDQVFWVKISDPEKKKEKTKQPDETDDTKIGLPEFILVYKDPAPEGEQEKRLTWDQLEASGRTMGFETIMDPFVEGDVLEKIYINMDSSVLKNYKTALKTEIQMTLADKRYISTVYFHTLFLFTISKNKRYSMRQMEGEVEKERDLVEYLKDLFESYYSQFLLNFEIAVLIESLE
jgi:hypothetical protein